MAPKRFAKDYQFLVLLIVMSIIYYNTFYKFKPVTVQCYNGPDQTAQTAASVHHNETSRVPYWLSRFETITDACKNPLPVHDFAALRPPSPRFGCPDRYISTNEYGQFNNHIWQTLRLLILGAVFNRTVITPANFDLGQYFDFSDLCIMTDHKIPPQIEQSVKRRPIRAFLLNDGDAPFQYFYSMPTQRNMLDQGYLGLSTGYHQIGCLMALVPGLELTDTMILFPRLFYTKIPKQLHVDMMKYFHFKQDIRYVGDAYIRDTFGGRPFMGIHARAFEGGCIHRNKRYPQLQQELDKICALKWEYVKDVASKVGFDVENDPIYLSTDEQDKERDSQLLSHANVKVFVPPTNLSRTLVDIYILSKSAFFLGNPDSTFALTVSMVRESYDANNWSSNLFPSYDGTDYPLQYVP